MATLTLTIKNVTEVLAFLHWDISGMGATITRAGLCTERPDGTTTMPGTILAAATASGGAASGNYNASVGRYPDGVFECYGFGQSSGGNYYSAGGYQSISWDWPTDPRPDNWSWWSTVAPGQPIALSAAEWNAFCGRIDEFRVYTGRDVWPTFLPVSSGTAISADIVNEARRAIAPMGPTAPLPAWANPGGVITAAYFNSLRAYLNSVP